MRNRWPDSRSWWSAALGEWRLSPEQKYSIVGNSAIPEPATKYRVLRLFVVLILGWLPALGGHEAVRSVTALFQLVEGGQVYFVPDHAGTLYLVTPVVVASACLLFLSPGLFLALALDAARGVGQWMLSGFAISLIVVSGVAGIAQAMIGSPLTGSAFAIIVAWTSLVCFGLLLMRVTRGRPLGWPLAEAHAGVTILSVVIFPVLLLVVLTPKFYWENFNPDGAHAFESARLLLFQILPFWDPSAGDIASFPGITSMLVSFPTSWFIRLFGEVEASARLPIVLYLVALYGVLLALVEHGRNKIVGLPERLLIWLGLAVYIVVMAFSATYNPYAADIALPATQDTLLMVCFLGFVLAFLKSNHGWMGFFLTLTYLSSPGGVVLVGLWLLAVILFWKPRPMRQIAVGASSLIACMVAAAITPAVLAIIGVPPPGSEHAILNLLKRLNFLQLGDWRRIAFLVVPSGILPAFSLVAWRRQDQVARALTIVTVAYFAFFYIQAYTSLHYFAPVMLLPLIVFGRSDLVAGPRHRGWKLTCAVAAGIAALVISLPKDATPDTSGRRVGAAIEDRIGGYNAVDPVAFRRSSMLRHLFPYGWESTVPFESYGGSPLVWYHYAHRKKDSLKDVNYILSRATDIPPTAMRLIAEEDGVALYVRSDSVWNGHRALRPPTPAGSKVYAIQRDLLFVGRDVKNGPSILNLKALLEQRGWDIERWIPKK